MHVSQEPKIPVDLTGVPETLLWTLFFRAQEAARPDALLRDPVAVELVKRIDYPFEERFNQGSGWAQWQALRALTFDNTIRRFLTDHPEGTIVSLGEGLETQFWRVDNGRLRWVGVDLPEVSGLRNQALCLRSAKCVGCIHLGGGGCCSAGCYRSWSGCLWSGPTCSRSGLHASDHPLTSF